MSTPLTKQGSGAMPAHPKPSKRIKDPELLRRFRLENAGEPCWACERHTGIHVHHVKFRSQGGDDAKDNLRWLCGSCHDTLHGIRSVW